MSNNSDWTPASREHLSHDMPCGRCGHAMHTFLACSDTCDCVPVRLPSNQDPRLISA